MAVIDLSGGLAASVDYGVRDLRAIGEDGMRDAVSVWIYDDKGRFGFPRLALEASGPDWDSNLVQVSVAFPDGRILDASGPRPARQSEDENGNPSIFAADGIEFRCVEPFKRWTASFNGLAVDTTSEAQRDRKVDSGVKTNVAIEMELTIVAPPWITPKKLVGENGSVEAARALGDVLPPFFDRSGIRYEQLVRAAGTLRVADEQWSFTGSGVRIRRNGVRNIAGLSGCAWQTAIFPSGRGFAYRELLPNRWQEAFVLDDGRLVPARAFDVPWMTTLTPSGEDVSFVLESKLGRHEIQGETVYSFFIPNGEEVPTEGAWPLHWQLGGGRYTWDGEEAYGVMERVSSPDKVDF